MRHLNKSIRVLFPAIAVVVLAVVPALPSQDASSGRRAVLFSQGQAADTSQDHVKGRQEAIRDFQTMAVTQAIGRYLSPSEMATRLSALQESVLQQPERYVETYQIFSEGSVNGMYRVTGQVTVALDTLKGDLQKFDVRGSPEQQADESSGEEGSTRAEDRADGDREGGGGESGAVAASAAEPGKSGESAREPAAENREVLWAVTEKWDQEWSLATELASPLSLFAGGMLQELEDFGWSLHLPQKKSFAVDRSGNISTDQVLSLAKEMGVDRAVIGAVALRQRQGEGTRLIALLRVLNVPLRRSTGEVRKEMPVEEGTNQEAAMALASAIAPQLDRLLDGSSREGSSAREPVPAESPGTGSSAREPLSTESSGAGSSAREPLPGGPSTTAMATATTTTTAAATPPLPSSPPVESSSAAGAPAEAPALEGGEWLVRMRAKQQLPAWHGMEKLLREQFRSMQIKSLQFGAGEVVAILEGVDGQAISSLNGTRLPGGEVIRVDSSSPQERTVNIVVSRDEAPAPDPNQ